MYQETILKKVKELSSRIKNIKVLDNTTAQELLEILNEAKDLKEKLKKEFNIK